jgi:hypothetical protein
MSLDGSRERYIDWLESRLEIQEVREVSGVYSARVARKADKTITTALVTAIDFDVERWNYGDLFNPTLNNTRLTAPADGIYAITGNVSWAQNDTGDRRLRIRLDGATNIAQVRVTSPAAALSEHMIVSTQYELDKDQYVELVVYHTRGSDLNIEAALNYSPEFMMTMIAPKPI